MKKLFIALILITNFGFCQEQNSQKILIPKEKVYLITDRESYNAGENIWFSAFLVDESLAASSISQLVHVDIVDQNNQLIDSRLVKSEQGIAVGDFILDEKFKESLYRIKAYTSYQLNYPDQAIFSKDISLFLDNSVDLSNEVWTNFPPINDKKQGKKQEVVDIQFFPEGGDLIAGNPSIIAFKAIDSSGKSVEVKGEVLNSKNESISQIESQYLGMGIFPLFPEEGESYHATITVDDQIQTVQLPKVNTSGNAIQVTEFKPSNYSITIITDQIEGYVLGFSRGQQIFNAAIDETKRVMANVESLPSGIVKFILVDNKFNPLAERQIFHYSDQVSVPNLDFKSIASNQVQQIETNGDLIDKGLFSLRVIDNRFFQENDLNIQTYLLISSDLKGTIENPRHYFDESIGLKERKAKLDLVMRTHGWSKFGTSDAVLKYPVENEGANLYFYTKEFSEFGNQDKPIAAQVSLSSLNPIMQFESESNNQGVVLFDNIDLEDSITFIVKANYENSFKQKKKSISEVFDPITVSMYDGRKFAGQMQNISQYYPGKFLTKEKFEAFRKEDWRVNSISGDIQIDEVVIQSKSSKNPRFNRPFSISSSTRILSEDREQALYLSDFLRGIAGVTVVGNGLTAAITIRGPNSLLGGTEPLFTLNGMAIDANFALSYPVQDIDYVEVVNRAAASIFGSDGSNGVISIFTKKGELKGKNFDTARGVLTVTIPGYYKAREYYNPMFVDTSDKKVYSSTLYWNPKLSGNTISFKTPEFSGKYVVSIEGISEEGEPVVIEKMFEVY